MNPAEPLSSPLTDESKQESKHPEESKLAVKDEAADPLSSLEAEMAKLLGRE